MIPNLLVISGDTGITTNCLLYTSEVKAIAQGNLTRNGDDITDFLGDFSELDVYKRQILVTKISSLMSTLSRAV